MWDSGCNVGEMSGRVYGSTSRSKLCFYGAPPLSLAGLFDNNPRFSVPMSPPSRCGFFDTSQPRSLLPFCCIFLSSTAFSLSHHVPASLSPKVRPHSNASAPVTRARYSQPCLITTVVDGNEKTTTIESFETEPAFHGIQHTE